jgi:hypothetical protein
MHSRIRSGLWTLALMALSLSALAAPRAEIWDRWTEHDARSRTAIDHKSWDGWLSRNVVKGSNGGNRVTYGRVSAEDRKLLADYLAGLQNLPISRYNRSEQKAYWINLYNAATVKLILDHYPVESITKLNLSPGIFAHGPWDRKLLKVEGEEVSLNDIEHRILRPIWHDPLIHYGLNCASLGCPDLATRAYTAANCDQLLLAGGRAYVNSPRGMRIKGGRLVVSSIYDWYKSDFGGSNAGVIAHLKSLATPERVRQLSVITRIDGYEYNWALNEAR